MIALDIGAAEHEGHGGDSINVLLREYPSISVVLAFDPHPALVEGMETRRGDVPVLSIWAAAWTHPGFCSFTDEGIASYTSEFDSAAAVPCFDLARLIQGLMPGDPDRLLVKMNVEGGEYTLLPHLIETRADSLIEVLWVQWHMPDLGREAIQAQLRCGEQRSWP
jgi:FkbM family methyltransferase